MKRACGQYHPDWVLHLGDCIRDAMKLQEQLKLKNCCMGIPIGSNFHLCVQYWLRKKHRPRSSVSDTHILLCVSSGMECGFSILVPAGEKEEPAA